ncbi:Coenzyme F420 hydrogenase/dehydrogenase, beta subunit C-terminal domain [Parasporobacterium paucivorans]|uniref:Coenzyme F420 hydrogenase/dehydrogenase, beta subunit C-terminal domain n=1 Tax=Parasporobacterium paucivorans TaxID=115544 RepID=UPI001FA88F4E|nr:Coenzyme F420 hydrogenase/dehydrogenase, beta subunit C-terminal domain [Parasporobacterium paucivorans]
MLTVPPAVKIRKCYAAFSKNETNRLNSSSGGIFDLIARFFLGNNDYIAGACFDEKFSLNHIITNKVEDLEKLKGSKYIQSNINFLYCEIRDALPANKVMFVGTPCQVAGLKSFLGKENDNLYTVGLFCHGVPSSKIFHKYLHEMEERYKDKIHRIEFRNKEAGWSTYQVKITMGHRIYVGKNQDDNYMQLFLQDVCLRPSCERCAFKLYSQVSDLVLGDFWGIDNVYPELNDQKGISAVVVRTVKGKELMRSISKDLVLKECTLKNITDGNPGAAHSVLVDQDKRRGVFEHMEALSMDELKKKYAATSFKTRCKNELKKVWGKWGQ